MARSWTGVIRQFKERREKDDIVWNFLLERSGVDKDGNPFSPLPVEMRGVQFQGILADGHKVEVEGGWKKGRLLRTKRAYNMTTNSPVEAKGKNIWPKVLLGFIAFIVFVFVIALLLSIASNYRQP